VAPTSGPLSSPPPASRLRGELADERGSPSTQRVRRRDLPANRRGRALLPLLRLFHEYRREAVELLGEHQIVVLDAVLDLIGGETQRRSFSVLRRGGKLISAVSHPDQDLAKSHGVDAIFFLVNVTQQYLTEIADQIDSGKLRTRVGAVLPLADAREAHFILEGRRPPPKGKIVLAVEAR
jgi:Zinc-binding dehydrogenase